MDGVYQKKQSGSAINDELTKNDVVSTAMDAIERSEKMMTMDLSTRLEAIEKTNRDINKRLDEVIRKLNHAFELPE